MENVMNSDTERRTSAVIQAPTKLLNAATNSFKVAVVKISAFRASISLLITPIHTKLACLAVAEGLRVVKTYAFWTAALS